VGNNADLARAAARWSLAARLPWADVQLDAEEVSADVDAFVEAFGAEGMARNMPNEWLDAFSAAGTPEHAADIIHKVIDAGADSIIFQPLDGDPACLDEYIQHLMPTLKTDK
jgi:alkanesulfonate monooxygenase SsuD/methylene tetrahydromethanopterin reductase-like flavin-dependent oxidoreductase (luciferase family)